MRSTLRPFVWGTSSQSGQMSSRSPTVKGLKYCFQLLAQSSSRMAAVLSVWGIFSAVYRSVRNERASVGFASGDR